MTINERVTALEALLAGLSRGVSVDGRIPYLQFNGRIGVMTNFWARQPYGQGAALSVGTAIDRFGVYAEMETAPDGFLPCDGHPTTAFYGAVLGPHRPGESQANIAFEAHAGNGPSENVALYADGDINYWSAKRRDRP